jgi:hypothetical protein
MAILYGENTFTLQIHHGQLRLHQIIESYYGARYKANKYGALSRTTWHASTEDTRFRDVAIQYAPGLLTDTLYFHERYSGLPSPCESGLIRFLSLEWTYWESGPVQERVNQFSHLFRGSNLTSLKLIIHTNGLDYDSLDPARTLARSYIYGAVMRLNGLRARRVVIEGDILLGDTPDIPVSEFISSKQEPMAMLLSTAEWGGDLARCVQNNWEQHRRGGQNEGEETGASNDDGDDDGDKSDEGDNSDDGGSHSDGGGSSDGDGEDDDSNGSSDGDGEDDDSNGSSNDGGEDDDSNGSSDDDGEDDDSNAAASDIEGEESQDDSGEDSEEDWEDEYD